MSADCLNNLTDICCYAYGFHIKSHKSSSPLVPQTMKRNYCLPTAFPQMEKQMAVCSKLLETPDSAKGEQLLYCVVVLKSCWNKGKTNSSCVMKS